MSRPHRFQLLSKKSSLKRSTDCAKKGTSILYISHRLEEIYKLSDRLTVMRDGENVGVLNREEITPQKVTTMMIGHEVRDDKNRERRQTLRSQLP